ncbi:MAG: hypothetical protein ACTSYX_10085 [Candidatus Thorarchaeota archaeon]
MNHQVDIEDNTRSCAAGELSNVRSVSQQPDSLSGRHTRWGFSFRDISPRRVVRLCAISLTLLLVPVSGDLTVTDDGVFLNLYSLFWQFRQRGFSTPQVSLVGVVLAVISIVPIMTWYEWFRCRENNRVSVDSAVLPVAWSLVMNEVARFVYTNVYGLIWSPRPQIVLGPFEYGIVFLTLVVLVPALRSDLDRRASAAHDSSIGRSRLARLFGRVRSELTAGTLVALTVPLNLTLLYVTGNQSAAYDWAMVGVSQALWLYLDSGNPAVAAHQFYVLVWTRPIPVFYTSIAQWALLLLFLRELSLYARRETGRTRFAAATLASFLPFGVNCFLFDLESGGDVMLFLPLTILVSLIMLWLGFFSFDVDKETDETWSPTVSEELPAPLEELVRVPLRDLIVSRLRRRRRDGRIRRDSIKDEHN